MYAKINEGWDKNRGKFNKLQAKGYRFKAQSEQHLTDLLINQLII
jgi:hypothetical protein